MTWCQGATTVPRHYFMLQTNSGEQFFLFTSLAAWLVRAAGRHLESPQVR